jgi:hypothetical protein
LRPRSRSSGSIAPPGDGGRGWNRRRRRGCGVIYSRRSRPRITGR